MPHEMIPISGRNLIFYDFCRRKDFLYSIEVSTFLLKVSINLKLSLKECYTQQPLTLKKHVLDIYLNFYQIEPNSTKTTLDNDQCTYLFKLFLAVIDCSFSRCNARYTNASVKKPFRHRAISKDIL